MKDNHSHWSIHKPMEAPRALPWQYLARYKYEPFCSNLDGSGFVFESGFLNYWGSFDPHMYAYVPMYFVWNDEDSEV